MCCNLYYSDTCVPVFVIRCWFVVRCLCFDMLLLSFTRCAFVRNFFNNISLFSPNLKVMNKNSPNHTIMLFSESNLSKLKQTLFVFVFSGISMQFAFISMQFAFIRCFGVFLLVPACSPLVPRLSPLGPRLSPLVPACPRLLPAWFWINSALEGKSM